MAILNRETFESIRSELNTVLAAIGNYVTLTGTQTLTNKTLTSPVLTTPQINDASLDHQYVFVASELAADRNVTLPALTGNDSFVFQSHTQPLTNKTIDADSNTITNIDNADIKSGAAIDATKIADGSISNTEFQYLNNASSNIQSQLDAKQIASSTSTLYDNVFVSAGNDTVADSTALNKIFDTSNAGASTFTLNGGASTFPVGGAVHVYNESGSAGNITLTAGGGVTLVAIGGATVATSRGATCRRIGANLWVTSLW